VADAIKCTFIYICTLEVNANLAIYALRVIPGVIIISGHIIDKLNQVAQRETGDQVNYWADKSPCWEMCHCPAIIREECPAPRYQFLPCWQIEGTYCKLDDYGETGRDISICLVCRVYKKYGKDEPIEIKLFGRGIDSSLKSLGKTAEL
jgi:hypothetical protein